MIKNLIFDLGDVLMEYRATEMLMDYGLSREEALALDDLMFYDPLWAILDKGTMTNEEVIAGYAKKYPKHADAIGWFIRHGEYMHVPRPKVWKRVHELKVFAEEIRVETLKIIHSRGFGHVGGSMSLADAMAVLYGEVMNVRPEEPRWEDRDWFVLSKGHGGPVMYATLGLKGFYPVEDAYTLNQPHTRFPSHTDRRMTPGVDLTTGSLGQGMSEAVGAALANKMKGKTSHVFVTVGDGEADEGQIWEGAQFAAHYKLDHLICLIDDNKRQLDGTCEQVMGHAKGIGAKFDAFGWNVINVADGNDVSQIYDAVMAAYETEGKPTCIVLNTIKGKGATFAEPIGAHSSQPSEEEWEEAIKAAEERLVAVRAQ